MGYGEWGIILPLLGETGAEDGVQVLTEAIDKTVDMQTSLHIIERNLASFVIQKDSYFTGLGRQY